MNAAVFAPLNELFTFLHCLEGVGTDKVVRIALTLALPHRTRRVYSKSSWNWINHDAKIYEHKHGVADITCAITSALMAASYWIKLVNIQLDDDQSIFQTISVSSFRGARYSDSFGTMIAVKLREHKLHCWTMMKFTNLSPSWGAAARHHHQKQQEDLKQLCASCRRRSHHQQPGKLKQVKQIIRTTTAPKISKLMRTSIIQRKNWKWSCD